MPIVLCSLRALSFFRLPSNNSSSLLFALKFLVLTQPFLCQDALMKRSRVFMEALVIMVYSVLLALL